MNVFFKGLYRYILNQLIVLDLVVNSLTGGDPFETVSSRLGRRNRNTGNPCKPCQWICWALDKVDPNHCVDSAKSDASDREVFRL